MHVSRVFVCVCVWRGHSPKATVRPKPAASPAALLRLWLLQAHLTFHCSLQSHWMRHWLLLLLQAAAAGVGAHMLAAAA